MRNFSVLLTDDEENVLTSLEQGIDWEAIHVTQVFKAASLKEAIRILEKNDVDMIITDIEMPNGSGLDLIRWCRRYRENVVSIFYTGHADFRYAQEALRIGAADYVLKPIPFAEMEKTILRLERELQQREGSITIPDIFAEDTDAAHADIVRQVQQLIAQHLFQPNLQREDLASMVHVSPGHLGRIFKKVTGKALSDYITLKRIAVAKQLLLKTTLPITVIAERVGISYSSYFTKLFKEHVGLTPQEYRQNAKSTKSES